VTFNGYALIPGVVGMAFMLLVRHLARGAPPAQQIFASIAAGALSTAAAGILMRVLNLL
jgi:hypothetical protein